MDCGPTCLRMVAKFYGKNHSLDSLRERTQIGKEGVTLLGISEAAEQIGFRTLATKLTLAQLTAEATLPAILHWNQEHFVVLYKVRKNKFFIADPGRGLLGVYKFEGERLVHSGELSTHGIGPHQVSWMPDGETLVVANGGIRTEAESRVEMNLNAMEPSLVLMRRDGSLIVLQVAVTIGFM